MITFLGAIIFITVIAIGAADWMSGLRPFQKYTAPWRVAGATHDAPDPPRRRRRRAHDS
jgi:hypothetical protein